METERSRFKAILSYIVSHSTAQTTWDPATKYKQSREKQRPTEHFEASARLTCHGLTVAGIGSGYCLTGRALLFCLFILWSLLQPKPWHVPQTLGICVTVCWRWNVHRAIHQGLVSSFVWPGCTWHPSVCHPRMEPSAIVCGISWGRLSSQAWTAFSHWTPRAS